MLLPTVLRITFSQWQNRTHSSVYHQVPCDLTIGIYNVIVMVNHNVCSNATIKIYDLINVDIKSDIVSSS